MESYYIGIYNLVAVNRISVEFGNYSFVNIFEYRII